MKTSVIFYLLLLISCGKTPEEDESMTEVPDKTQYDEKRAATVSRLPRFLDRGFVISWQNGGMLHQGDSLLFSGLALYSLNCQEGQPIADGFAEMLKSRDGGAYRHPDQADKEVSLDGLLGMFRGINKRVKVCGEKDLWAGLMRNTRARIAASMPAEFNLVSAMMAYTLGLSDVPDLRRMETLSIEIAAWAKLVRTRKAAAYRIHLGLLALQTMEEMGAEISDKQRDRFAESTDGLQMATTDHFCKRSGLVSWLNGFKYDVWQYQFQRSPVWEAPDGYGQEHPGIDYLVGYADLYKGATP